MTTPGVVGVCFALVLCATCQSDFFTYDDYLNDYPFHPPEDAEAEISETSKPEEIRLLAGSDLSIKCKAPTCQEGDSLHWEFKACKPEKINSFDKFHSRSKLKDNSSWTRINQTQGQDKCHQQLKIQRCGKQNSGLYRCVKNREILRIYEVEVLDSFIYGGPPPKVLEVTPRFLHLPQHAPLIIKCKVSSKLPPLIVWFKETQSSDPSAIEYYEKTYKKINSDQHLAQDDSSIYLSKVIVENATVMDSGTYVCLVVTESGHDTSIASIRVEDPISSKFAQHSPQTQDTSFSLLFLIPFPLALVPLIVWLCYYRRKSRGRREHQQCTLLDGQVKTV